MILLETNIDGLIETYDFAEDKNLQDLFQLISKTIKNYDADAHQYGEVIAAHLKRTSELGRDFLKKLGFSDTAAGNFYHANLLQDLGKISPKYDSGIWNLPHRPTEEERAEKRLHAGRGPEVLDSALQDDSEELKNHPHIQVTKAIQLYHHERIDGSGQFALTGDKMGDVIKVICIIDAYDGDMIHRPHQPCKRTPEETLERMKSGKKYQGAFDLEMLKKFCEFIEKRD
ncbi:MAG: hypothetical protein MRY79_08695 [Alphaproteobacteria bacterium]|nr:hypothetical protein [Alphaproteobacteria bacterium]